MKNVFLLCFFLVSMLSQSVFAQKKTDAAAAPKADKLGIGILQIYDDSTHLNYSQLFQMMLRDNPVQRGKTKLSVGLVEHQSQAEWAVAAKFLANKAVVNIYQAGKLAKKDTIAIKSLEPTYEVYTLLLNIHKTSEGFEIGELDTKSELFKAGVRQGDLLTIVSGKSTMWLTLKQVQQFLDSDKKGETEIYIKHKKSGNIKSYKLEREKVQRRVPEWPRPLQVEQLQVIFKEVANLLFTPIIKSGLTLKNRTFDVKSFEAAKNRADQSGKCLSYTQMPTAENRKFHPVVATVGMDSIFQKEKFDKLNRSKTAPTGEPALEVLRYYNFDQNRTHLYNNGKVSEEVKDVVRKLSGPFFNKPGVFANYFIAAKEYETAKNYPAALNQYYAVLIKTDDLICGELTKVKAKKVVLRRIAHCTRQMGQKDYALMTDFAADCLELTLRDKNLQEQNANFYDFSEKVMSLSTDIEDKLAQQRSEKAWAIATAVISAGAGVATFNLDVGLATSFFNNSLNIIDQNDEFNAQINAALWQATNNMQFNLPPELQEDDNNPYEAVLTAAVAYSVERTSSKTALFNFMSNFAKDKPALAAELEKMQQQWALTGQNLDHLGFIRQLQIVEKIYFNYEKRGLKVPATARP